MGNSFEQTWRCDNCGATEKHKLLKGNRADIEKRPDKWGYLKVSATTYGNYPNNIGMSDVCHDCLCAVHDAVTKALKERQPT